MRTDIKVGADWNNRSLRAFLADQLPNVPPKGLRRAIQRGQITVDHERVSSNHVLSEGQMVRVHIQSSFGNKSAYDVVVIYEDEFIAAINKPAGIAIASGKGRGFADQVKSVLNASTQSDALPAPVVLHRLDKPTCGVLLFAKTRTALTLMSQQFQSHDLLKEYRAWVTGVIQNSIGIDFPLDDKDAYTRVIPIQSSTVDTSKTEVQLYPKTGRTHQLRRHLSLQGHPIIGDSRYGTNNAGEHLMLCALSVTFEHPDSGKTVKIEAPLPKYFVNL